MVRRLHRCDYYASAFVFPLALWVSDSGHTLLAHCPDDYNRVEIDDVDAGERLTAEAGREPRDFFHSRLAVSPSGRRLLTAGW